MKKNLKSKKSISKLPSQKKEIGGPKGLEPTRYGDWEKKGTIAAGCSECGSKIDYLTR